MLNNLNFALAASEETEYLFFQMAWFLIILSTFLFSYILQFLISNLRRKGKLPPGPIGLPLIGHLHLIGKNPHHDLSRLAKKYGSIIYTRFGSLPTVVVTSPSAAELFLKTYDLIFADRGDFEFGRYILYQHKDIFYGNYSSYWRNMRKLVTIELLSNRKISEYREMRKLEVSFLVDSVRKSAEMKETVDLSVKVMSLNGDMTSLMVFGRKCINKDVDEEVFKKALSELMAEAGAINIGDFFPNLQWLDLQGSARRMKKLSKLFDGIFEKIIDEHEEKNNKDGKQTRDFVDTLMGIMKSGEAEFEFDRTHVKAILLDMLVAGMETSTTVIEWTLSELLKHPTIIKKVQNELKEVVGMDQMVEESHLPKLIYLDCVIKETLRLHPVVPLLIHHSREDSVVNGFNIAKNTRILVNAWAIGRDPNVWKDPEKFSPERFIETNTDMRGQDFKLLPFGSGRRACAGIQLGLTVVQLVVAQLIHCFDWDLPNQMLPKDLDMNEHFGLAVSRANHLLAIPKYRLHC